MTINRGEYAKRAEEIIRSRIPGAHIECADTALDAVKTRVAIGFRMEVTVAVPFVHGEDALESVVRRYVTDGIEREVAMHFGAMLDERERELRRDAEKWKQAAITSEGAAERLTAELAACEARLRAILDVVAEVTP